MGITYTTLDPRFCPNCGRPLPPGTAPCVCGYSRTGISTPGGLGSPTGGRLQRLRWIPQATYFLIGTNVLVFLLMTVSGGSTRIDTLLNFGAMYRPLVVEGEYWRLVTPMFLHIGIMHLLFNMYALLVLGAVAEQLYGSMRFLYLYLLSGMGGSVASFFFSKAVSAGASGAIFGIAGLALIVGYRHRDLISTNLRSIVGRGIIPFVAFNLIYGLSNKGIDNSAHLGGLLTGVLLAWVVPPVRPEERLSKYGILSAGVLLPVAAIVVAFFFPFRSHLEMKKVDADFHLALQLEKENKLDESVAAYQRALGRRPDLPAIHNNLAVLYSRQKKFDLAEKEARQAVRLGGDEAMYHQTLGSILWQQGKLPEAVDQYRSAVQLESNNPEYHEALAELMAAQGKFKEAITEWETVKKLQPQDRHADQQIEQLRRHSGVAD